MATPRFYNPDTETWEPLTAVGGQARIVDLGLVSDWSVIEVAALSELPDEPTTYVGRSEEPALLGSNVRVQGIVSRQGPFAPSFTATWHDMTEDDPFGAPLAHWVTMTPMVDAQGVARAVYIDQGRQVSADVSTVTDLEPEGLTLIHAQGVYRLTAVAILDPEGDWPTNLVEQYQYSSAHIADVITRATGTPVVKANLTGGNAFTGAQSTDETFSDARGDVRVTPSRSSSGSTAAAAGDMNATILAGGNVTIPDDVGEVGDMLSVANVGSSDITVVGNGVTLFWAGEEGSLLLEPNVVVTLIKVASDRWVA